MNDRKPYRLQLYRVPVLLHHSIPFQTGTWTSWTCLEEHALHITIIRPTNNNIIKITSWEFIVVGL